MEADPYRGQAGEALVALRAHVDTSVVASALSDELSKVCECVCRLHAVPSCRVVCVSQENPELDAIWRLLQYFWNKHYQGIWQALQGYQWSQQVCQLSVQQPVAEGGWLCPLHQQWAVGTAHLCRCAWLTHARTYLLVPLLGLPMCPCPALPVSLSCRSVPS